MGSHLILRSRWLRHTLDLLNSRCFSFVLMPVSLNRSLNTLLKEIINKTKLDFNVAELSQFELVRNQNNPSPSHFKQVTQPSKPTIIKSLKHEPCKRCSPTTPKPSNSPQASHCYSIAQTLPAARPVKRIPSCRCAEIKLRWTVLASHRTTRAQATTQTSKMLPLRCSLLLRSTCLQSSRPMKTTQR